MKLYYKVIVILCLGLLLRLINLGDYSLTLDESFSFMNANGVTISSFSKINTPTDTQSIFQANLIDDSGNGLIHTLILKHWIDIGGKSVLYLRLLEVFIFCISFIYFYKLVKKFYNEKYLYLSLFLFSIHPLILLHNRELRTYSLGILIVLMVVYYFLNFIKTTNLKNTIILASVIIISFFTHFLLISIPISLMGIYIIQKKTNLKVGYLLFIISLFSLTVITWYHNGGSEGLLYMSQLNQNYINDIPKMTTSIATPINLVKGSLDMFLHYTGNFYKNLGFRNREILYLSIPTIVLFIFTIKKIKQFSIKKIENKILLIFIVLPFIFATVLAINSNHITSFLSKYSVWFVPFFILYIVKLY